MMPRSTRRTTDNVISMSSMEPGDGEIVQSQVAESDIARRAFEIYCERGRQDGHDVDDWLQAERELRADSSVTTAA
jgi:hypothetical protein